MARKYKRGRIWWGWYYETSGRQRCRSTTCTDPKAADPVIATWERAAADPTYAATHEASLKDALDHARLDRKVTKQRAEGTLAMYKVKAGHLVRVLGGETRLAQLCTARPVDAYVAQRSREGASPRTIAKELTVLRVSLKLAKRRGEFPYDIAAIMPEGFSVAYKPRRRFLPPTQVQWLMPELTPDRAARVAFLLATAARWGESDRARREDVDVDRQVVFLRGTKTETAPREVPLVGAAVDLMEYAIRHAEGEDGMLFRPWSNVRRDLHDACLATRHAHPGEQSGREPWARTNAEGPGRAPQAFCIPAHLAQRSSANVRDVAPSAPDRAAPHRELPRPQRLTHGRTRLRSDPRRIPGRGAQRQGRRRL
jgi:integrase